MPPAERSWQELLAQHLQSAERPLVVVLGPTASGKTAFSLDVGALIEKGIGEWEGADVVNADSRQLYRGLDVGTAKITAQEMRDVPHHLLSVLDPAEELTIARYKELAEAAIEEILSRKRVPLLVGGSMLYISAMIDGLEPLPAVDPALRAKLDATYDVDGGAALYAKLQELDPETAAAFHRNNKPYVIRAMEILEATGKPASEQKKYSSSPYDLLIFGMEWPRTEITRRIEARTPLLLAQGWVEEVLKLKRAGFDASTPAMKSHGYREVLAAIDAFRAAHVEALDDEIIASVSRDPALIALINAKTRQYAKRQMTWWRHDLRIHWISFS